MKGRKYDTGKPPVTQFLRQFPKAIAYLSQVSEYGHQKYGEAENDEKWDNWEHLENAKFRYEQAIGRHLLEKSSSLDESGFFSIAHAAWDAIAVLELILNEKDGS